MHSFSQHALTLTKRTLQPANVQTRKLILTPEEYVSIAYDNPQELSEKDIIEVINDFQSIASQFKGEATTKGTNAIQANTISKYYLTNNNTIDRRNITHSIDNSKLNIPIYEVELSKMAIKRISRLYVEMRELLKFFFMPTTMKPHPMKIT